MGSWQTFFSYAIRGAKGLVNLFTANKASVSSLACEITIIIAMGESLLILVYDDVYFFMDHGLPMHLILSLNTREYLTHFV